MSYRKLQVIKGALLICIIFYGFINFPILSAILVILYIMTK